LRRMRVMRCAAMVFLLLLLLLVAATGRER
jgi:hypothetical protein